jgi:hypothetical protein
MQTSIKALQSLKKPFYHFNMPPHYCQTSLRCLQKPAVLFTPMIA